jgi:hypothetical protein
MAMNEEQGARLPSLTTPALLVLMGFVVGQAFVVDGLLSLNTFRGVPGQQVMGSLVAEFIVVGAIWGLSMLKPSRPQIVALSVMLGFVALQGFGLTSTLVKNLIAMNFLGFWYWKTLGLLAADVLVCIGGIWGLAMLKPWKTLKGSDEPISPRTRRTNRLLGLAGLIAIAGALVLIVGTNTRENPSGLFSNGPVSLVIAIVAIACWLLSMLINKWYWYFSADEHERRADDVGNLLGWAVFMIVTPAWWIAARAGLLPQLDAMILWMVATGVSAIGYFWRRNR